MTFAQFPDWSIKLQNLLIQSNLTELSNHVVSDTVPFTPYITQISNYNAITKTLPSKGEHLNFT